MQISDDDLVLCMGCLYEMSSVFVSVIRSVGV